ncbi:TraM-binding TraD/TraG-like protein [Ureibacillus xyleni]|uniref:TraM-binding TraD/TraG-like protein n=1 Tax=Ureibacillus xyleni TaxID=614648 RepID=A0A285TIQ4_9BACL|nr:TraM recognition domain-containing protein [Ureibacillus xyleni]SOC22064.1 TraM-binding TraD/TraG-like protein [Ureibacillus xyleni]
MAQTNNPIIIGGNDPFTHFLITGPTRCGKTSTILLPMIFQLLEQKKRGKNLGLSLVEPKGDLIWEVEEFCKEMEIPYVLLDPSNPNTDFFNVMEGDIDVVIEATVAVLQSLFGKQEAFFQTLAELSTRNVTKLLKLLKGDDLTLLDLLATLRDEKLLRQYVEDLRDKIGASDLLSFFDNEMFGSLSDQYRKLIIGLRAQLENMTGNEKLRHIISNKSSINLDEHLDKGGVLLVNTDLGRLKKAGDAFGMFVTMHIQSAALRRPGTEKTRTPHFMIVDEYARYINPDVELFLSVAASSRVAGIFAIQSLGQLEIESGRIGAKAMKQAILTNCRNKIAFCGLSSADANEFAEEFGKDVVIMRQSTYKNKILLPKFFPESYRDTETEEYRYRPTYLQDQMKRFHFICKILNDGTPQKPIEGVGAFVPRNWREMRSWEHLSGKPAEKGSRGFLERCFKHAGIQLQTSTKAPKISAIFAVNPDEEGSKEFVEENAILLGKLQSKQVEPEDELLKAPSNDEQEIVKTDREEQVIQQPVEQSMEREKVVTVPVQSTQETPLQVDDAPVQKPTHFVVSEDEAYENGDTFF